MRTSETSSAISKPCDLRANDTDHDSKNISKSRRCFGSRSASDQCMSQSAAKEEGRPYDQEDKGAPSMDSAGPSCVSEEAHWIEPHQEADDSDSSVPDKLSHDVGKDESGPVVSATFTLSVQASELVIARHVLIILKRVPCFVELSLHDKHGDDL